MEIYMPPIHNYLATSLFVPILFMLLLSGCGGGGGDGGSGNPTPTPVINYSVTTSVSAGGNVSPASLSVVSGSSATFTITPADGYLIDKVEGCNGTLTGGIFVTGSINSTCEVKVTFILNQFSVTLSSSELNFHSLNQIQKVSATVKNIKNEIVPNALVEWKSSSENIATVSSIGEIKAIKDGEVNVTAKYKDVTNDVKVLVKQVPAAVEMSKNLINFKNVSNAETINAIFKDSLGNVIEKPVVWASSKNSVASVDSVGKVVAVGLGSTQISASMGALTKSTWVNVGTSISLILKKERIYEFFNYEQIPPYTYEGVTYPGGPVQIDPTTTEPFDLWTDGSLDLVVPLIKGYASGSDTRMTPLFFRNVNGDFQHVVPQQAFPKIAGTRRVASVNLPNDPLKGLFFVQHDTHDKQAADALFIAASKDSPSDQTSKMGKLPLATVYNRDTAVNAHAMASGDLNGDGLTDFVVGDWDSAGVDKSKCENCGPYFLIQQSDGSWKSRVDSFLKDITFNQPMKNGKNGNNLLIDLGLADLNGDGLADIIAGYGHGSTNSWVYLNKGNANFDRQSAIELPTTPNGVDNSLHLKTFLLDFNRDKKLDIVVLYSKYSPFYAGYGFQFLMNNGNDFSDKTLDILNSIPENEVPAVRMSWSDNYQFVDLNSDGYIDLIGTHGRGDTWSARLRVWINDGNRLNEIQTEMTVSDAFRQLGWHQYKPGAWGSLIYLSRWVDAKGSGTVNWFNYYEIEGQIPSVK
jgi:hypothetical protein